MLPTPQSVTPNAALRLLRRTIFLAEKSVRSSSSANIKGTLYRAPFILAEEKGFEPLCLLGKRFSRPPRYDHFDIPPNVQIIISLFCDSVKMLCFLFKKLFFVEQILKNLLILTKKCYKISLYIIDFFKRKKSEKERSL